MALPIRLGSDPRRKVRAKGPTLEEGALEEGPAGADGGLQRLET